jgi:hypothetical protein
MRITAPTKVANDPKATNLKLGIKAPKVMAIKMIYKSDTS